MNPENKVCKDLDKFCPKKGKGQPKSDANTSEAHNVEEVPLATAKPEVDNAILNGDIQIGKKNDVEPCDSTSSSHLHHLDCIHLQEMVIHVNSMEPTVFWPFWSSSCSPTKLTRNTLNRSSMPTHARSSTSSWSTSMIGTMAATPCLPNLAMPLNLHLEKVTEGQAVDILQQDNLHADTYNAYESSLIVYILVSLIMIGTAIFKHWRKFSNSCRTTTSSSTLSNVSGVSKRLTGWDIG